MSTTVSRPGVRPPYRIVFMGTPDFAAVCLKALLDAPDLSVVLTVSQPDQPQGRRRELVPTPVHRLSDAAGIPCAQPDRVRTDAFLALIRDARPDFIVTAAYGKLLPQAVLDVPAVAPVNVHASLLPRYRGASPVHRAIIDGEAETGITIMRMTAEMDAGGIYAQAALAIEPDETAAELMDRLAALGAGLLPGTLNAIAGGRLPREQDAGAATYAGLLKRETGRMDWSADAGALHNLVRGTSPWPGAQTTLNGRVVKIHRTAVPDASDWPPALLSNASNRPNGAVVDRKKGRLLVLCGQRPGRGPDVLEILELQLPGGRRLRAADCAHNLPDGAVFGAADE